MERRRQAAKDRKPGADAARCYGGARSCGPDAQRQGRRPAGRAQRSSGAEQSYHFHAQRQVVGRGEHHHGRELVLGSDSAAEGGERNRDRGVSAEQGRDVMRILDGKAAERAVAKQKGRASRLEEVEPAVRRIIRDVRKSRDKALLRYATLWD